MNKEKNSLIDNWKTIVSKKMQIPKYPRKKLVPMSSNQRRIWIHEKMSSIPLYNMPVGFKIFGMLNIKILFDSFSKIIQRHESLRTTFVELEDRYFQVVHNVIDFKKNIINLKSEIDEKKYLKVKKIMTDERQRVFDLANGPLLCLTICELNEGEHLLIINMHHIISDGWSVAVMIKDFLHIYESEISRSNIDLKDLPVQYVDFSLWQEQQLTKEFVKGQLKYWKNQLDNVPILDLPVDYTRSEGLTYKGSKESLIFSNELTNKISIFCKKLGIPNSVFLLSIFKLLLFHYSQNKDFCVGIATANRKQKELENLIGFFVNTLAIRSKIDLSWDFTGFLMKTHENCLDAYDNQDIPFEKLLEEVRFKRRTSYSPIIQVMFILREFLNEKLSNSYLQLEYLDISNDISLFDLTMSVTYTSSDWLVSIDYNRELFLSSTIKNMLDYYLILVKDSIKNPNVCLNGLLSIIPIQKLKASIYVTSQEEIFSKACKFWLKKFNIPNILKISKLDSFFSNQENRLSDESYGDICLIFIDNRSFHFVKEFLEKLNSVNQKNLVLVMWSPFLDSLDDKKIYLLECKHIKHQFQHCHSFVLLTQQEDLVFIDNLPSKENNAVLSITALMRTIISISCPTKKLVILSCKRFLTSFKLNVNKFLEKFSYFSSNGVKLLIFIEENINKELKQAVKNFTQVELVECNNLDITSQLLIPSQLEDFSKKENISFEKIFFISDNFNDCLQVQMSFPEILTLNLNENISIEECLNSLWFVEKKIINLNAIKNKDVLLFINSRVKFLRQTELISDVVLNFFNSKSILDDCRENLILQNLENSQIPKDYLEEIIFQVWKDILELPNINLNEDFFTLGGHSLKATRIISKINNLLGIEVPLNFLFENATIASLAKKIKDSNITEKKIELPSVIPIEHCKSYLSHQQERLWFLNLVEPENPIYNLCTGLDFKGELNLNVLEKSVGQIINRHDILRTTFDIKDGYPQQFVQPKIFYKLPIIDFLELSPEEQQKQTQAFIEKECKKPFKLSEDKCLLRLYLLQYSKNHFFMLAVVHHIAFDGWSFGIFLRELSIIYSAYFNNEECPLLNLEVQYKDFAYWQRNHLEGRINNQLEYWKQQLQDLPILELPFDHIRPVTQTYRGKVLINNLPNNLIKSLKTISNDQNVTLFMVLFAAFSVLIYRYTGQKDIPIGIPIANRNRFETENNIGFFVNTLVIRLKLNCDLSFKDILQQVKKLTLDAYSNQDVPLERLINELDLRRDVSYTPLFQVMFNYINTPKRNILLPFVKTEVIDIKQQISKFDLDFYLEEKFNGSFQTSIEYNTDLFEEDTIRFFLSRYQHLLETIVFSLDIPVTQIPMFNNQERLEMVNKKNTIYPKIKPAEFMLAGDEETIINRFMLQKTKYPEKIAIQSYNVSLTYKQLYKKVKKIAFYVQNKFEKLPDRIALLFEFSTDMIVGMLSSLLIEKTYVPLDTNYPEDNLFTILKHSEVDLILTNNKNLELANKLINRLDSEYTVHDELRNISPKVLNIDELISIKNTKTITYKKSNNNLAYILYTSGSTGEPKGVMQTQLNVLRHIQNYTNGLCINNNDKLLQLASFNFDAAVMDIYGSLLNGATLFLVNIKNEGIEAVIKTIEKEEITIYHSTPSVYRYIFGPISDKTFPSVRIVVLGGESVRKKDIEIYHKCFNSECIFINGLGPTECTLALQYFIDQKFQIKSDNISVGYPVNNVEILLLDENKRVTDLYGEIAFRSQQIAVGYWKLHSKTKKVFSELDTEGKTTYSTGDMARQMSDGTYQFLGRKDSQIKIRGYRIEKEEIETRLQEHPYVKEVVILGRKNLLGEQQLVAYIVTHENQKVEKEELKSYLSNKIPAFMVPAHFIFLNTIPLTPNGKLNEKALPIPNFSSQLEQQKLPTSRQEVLIANIWQEVLQIKTDIGTNINFFEVGGHSLALILVQKKLQEHLQKNISIIDLFKYPTISTLAAFIDEKESDSVNFNTTTKNRANKRRGALKNFIKNQETVKL